MTGAQDPDFDALRELEDALRVTPSAGFAARVRARVAADARARRGRAWWLPAMAVAGVAVIAVVAGWPAAMDDAPPAVAPPDAALVRMPAPPPALAAPDATMPPATTAAPRAVALPRHTAPAPAGAAVDSPAPRVLIAGDEARALDRLLLALQGDLTPLPAFGATVDADTGTLLPPAPITLPEIDPQSLPVIRRDERHAVNGRTPR